VAGDSPIGAEADFADDSPENDVETETTGRFSERTIDPVVPGRARLVSCRVCFVSWPPCGPSLKMWRLCSHAPKGPVSKRNGAKARKSQRTGIEIYLCAVSFMGLQCDGRGIKTVLGRRCEVCLKIQFKRIETSLDNRDRFWDAVLYSL